MVLGNNRMRIVSLFLVLATIFGVLTGTDGICLEKHEAKAQITSADTYSSSSDSAPVSDCHHEGSPCHSCHLGHCAFIVSVTSVNLVAPVKEILPPGYLATLPSDYPSSLFRPPIAA